MQYFIKITEARDSFRPQQLTRLLNSAFKQNLFRSKRLAENAQENPPVILRVPVGVKNVSTLLRKVKETGVTAELTDQRSSPKSYRSPHR
jgi:hypothetical protein